MGAQREVGWGEVCLVRRMIIEYGKGEKWLFNLFGDNSENKHGIIFV